MDELQDNFDAIILRNAIILLEEALEQEEVEQEGLGMIIGRMGARIVGALEDGYDLGDGDGEYWEKVEVDIPGYRNMGDPSFKRHFRLSKETFELLLETLANYLVESGRVLRVRNPLDVPFLMVLWVMANPDTFRSVALRFGVLPGEVHFHYCYIIQCLREMAPLFIRWPDEAERDRIKARFEAYSGFPGIVGVIDGTHNVVTAPPTQKERYRNRHHTYSFNSMVVCDDNLLIRDAHIGEVGSLHDSRVFQRSPLYRKLVVNENDEMLRPDEHIIGDKAYALMDTIMVPFKNCGNLTQMQRDYNYALCKSRVRIEHTFGKAFNQWRRMKMLHSANTELAVDHFMASFVLHNFMILNGEKLLDLDDPTVLLEEDDEELDNIDDDFVNDIDDEDNYGNEEVDDLQGADRQNVPFNRLVVAAKLRGREKRIQIVNDL